MFDKECTKCATATQTIEEMENTVDGLRSHIAELLSELNDRTKVISELQAKLKEYETSLADCEGIRSKPKRNEFAIEDYDVFAIEYDIKTGKTVIGYIIDNRIHEWHMFCTARNHNRFVTRLQKKRAVSVLPNTTPIA